MRIFSVGITLVAFAALPAWGGEPDLGALSEISTEGTSAQVARGKDGLLVVTIRAKGDSHISDEAPLKMSLSGKDVVWSKSEMTRKDAHADPKSPAGAKYPNPQFVVPFKVSGESATVQVDVTFFLCTKDLCARQQKTVALPLTVKPAS